jgi:lipopolysaccharide exporter
VPSSPNDVSVATLWYFAFCAARALLAILASVRRKFIGSRLGAPRSTNVPLPGHRTRSRSGRCARRSDLGTFSTIHQPINPTRVRQRVALQAITLWIGLVLAQALSAVAVAISARHLDPAQFGLIAASVGLALFAGTLADFGVNAQIVRALAQGAHPDVYRQTLLQKVLVGLLLLVVAQLIAFSTTHEPSLRTAYVFSGLYLSLYFVASALAVPLRARQRFFAVALLQVVEKAVALSMTAALVTIGFEAEALTAGLAAGSFASCFGALAMLEPGFRRLAPSSLGDIHRLWSNSASFGVAAVASQLQRLDVAVVATIAGPTASGIYALPARLTSVLGALPTAYSMTIYPRLSTESARTVLPAGVVLFVATSAVLGTIFVFASTLLEVVVGRGYGDAVPIVRVFVVATAFATLNQPLSMALQARGHEKYVAQVVAAAAIVGLGGVALGASVAQALGAAFGFLSMQLLAVVLLGGRAIIAATVGPGDSKRRTSGN